MQAQTFGFKVTFLTQMDLTTCTALRIYVGRPDGVSPQWIDHELNVATDIPDKAKGTVNWLVADGDLPAMGTYRVQIVDHSAGRRVATDIGYFYVNENITDIAA